MRILSLIENTSATDKLTAEHGLSLYIEHNGKKYLLDTGATGAFLDNAARMRVELGGVKTLILSHNHYDHTGGVEPLLEKHPDIKIYARAGYGECITKAGPFYVNISHMKGLVEKHPDNFMLYNKFYRLDDGFYLMSDEIANPEFRCRDKTLYKRDGKKIVKDDFSHEGFVVVFPDIDINKGCVILSSCSHSGIINIIRTVRRNWENVPIIAFVGGMHLMGSSTKKVNCSEEYLDRMCDEIKILGIGTVYTCHCTGLKGYELMKARLGDQLQYLQTGEELEF